MKLKAKPGGEAVIEKFSAQSSKTAKYAKTVVKKREPSELKTKDSSAVGDTTSVSNSHAITVTSQDTAQKEAEKSGTAGSVA